MSALRPHQIPHGKQLIAALREHGAALDASDTGTGKTYAAVAVAAAMKIVPVVLCPKAVVPGWHRAAAALGWKVEAIGYEKARGVRRKKADGEREDYHSSDLGREIGCGMGSRWVWKQAFQMMIFDEAHRCGGMTSIHSKKLIGAKRQAEYVLCLSATAADRPEKMKALGYALGLHEGHDFQWWMMKHGVEPGHFGGYKFTEDEAEQRKAMAKLHKEIFPSRGSRMRKADIPGFPKTEILPKLVPDTTGKAATLLAEIRDLYLLREQQAQNAERRESILEMMIRRRQSLELLKVNHLVELVKDYAETSKVVVFVHYKDTIKALLASLPKSFGTVPVIDGDNTDDYREQVRQEFQDNLHPLLICNAQAGGVGLDLHDPTGQVERTALISPGWSAPQLYQVLGRVHRDGGAFSQQFLTGFADTLEEEILERTTRFAGNIQLLNDGVLSGAFQP